MLTVSSCPWSKKYFFLIPKMLAHEYRIKLFLALIFCLFHNMEFVHLYTKVSLPEKYSCSFKNIDLYCTLNWRYVSDDITLGNHNYFFHCLHFIFKRVSFSSWILLAGKALKKLIICSFQQLIRPITQDRVFMHVGAYWQRWFSLNI